jgi:cytochrome c biogenesis protein
MGEGFYRNSANIATIPAPVRVDAVVAALRKERYQISQTQEGDATYIYADRNGWAKLGTMFTHFSIVLFLIGAVTGALFGFSDDEVVIGEGASYDMVRGYNFQIRLNDFTEEWYIQGMPKDYSSDLSVMENGQEVVRKTIRVNDPLVYRGIKFSQSFYGVAPAVEVKDSQGKLLFSNIVPLFGSNVPDYETSSLWFPPNTNVMLSRPKKASGAAAARLEYQIRSGTQTREQGFMDVGKPLRSGDLEITFTGDREYTGLRMSSDPGVIVIWIASALMLLGMCSSFYLPRRRLWARIQPHGVDMAAFADRAVPIGQELDSLARSLAPEGVRPKREKIKS